MPAHLRSAFLANRDGSSPSPEQDAIAQALIALEVVAMWQKRTALATSGTRTTSEKEEAVLDEAVQLAVNLGHTIGADCTKFRAALTLLQRRVGIQVQNSVSTNSETVQ